MASQIRQATVADIPLIRALAHEVWPPTFAEILSPDQIEYMLDMMYSETSIRRQLQDLGHQYLLCFSESETAVGYASYQLNYLPQTTKLHKIYVLPQGQGSGYGKALISAVAKTAHAAGQERLRLDVNYQNPAARFYEHLGMRKVDEVTTEIGQGYLMEDWVYECELPTPFDSQGSAS
jgi:ribosomal protein S18 acetylase RimI-like enzyme